MLNRGRLSTTREQPIGQRAQRDLLVGQERHALGRFKQLASGSEASLGEKKVRCAEESVGVVRALSREGYPALIHALGPMTRRQLHAGDRASLGHGDAGEHPRCWHLNILERDAQVGHTPSNILRRNDPPQLYVG